MITALRSQLGTWFARILFGVLVISFAAFGIGDVIRWAGAETWIAKVGDRAIEQAELQQAYQTQLSQLSRVLGTSIDPTVEMKRGIAARALENLINESVLDLELRRLHLLAPEAAVGQEIASMREFRGADGQFNRQAMQMTLRQAGMSEGRFLDVMRASLAQRQLLGALRAGVATPQILARQVYQFQNEKRAAELVELPFAAISPADPTDLELQRWYENHPDRYTTPEYRRVKAVILAPHTLAGQIEITAQDLAAAYAARRAAYVTPARRSAEIIIIQDEAKASELAADWRGGADWNTMQKAAGEAGGSAVALTDARRAEFPDPALAAAVFAAAQGAVTTPLKNVLGWQVIRVTSITEGSERTLEMVRDELQTLILDDKASAIIHGHAQKIEDILATGTSLDDLPGDLGLVALTGTMDAQGTTMAGEPAPIPGTQELRGAIITASFAARPGDPPRLLEVRPSQAGGQSSTSSYFAIGLEAIIPPGLMPLADIRDTVIDDLKRDRQRRAQEAAAARILAAVRGGQSLEDAATVANVTFIRTQPTGRAEPAPGVPREVVAPLFGLKKGEATMVETAEAFLVAVAAEIIPADPVADAAGYDRTRAALSESLGNDINASFVTAVRTRAQPRINQKLLDNFVQP